MGSNFFCEILVVEGHTKTKKKKNSESRIVTHYEKIDHLQFLMKFSFWVWIDAEFSVSSTVKEPCSKKVPRPSYGYKIVHGSPVS